MAFFKCRQRGQPQPESRPRADAPAASAQETVDGLRRRARHRLVGAAVLVLAAVIGFPLLFDTQPRPVAVDAPITIPDKDKAPPLRGPAASPNRVAPAASLDEREEVVAPTPRRAEASTPAPASRAAETARDTRAEDEARARREAEARAKREEEAKAKREADAKAKREAEQAAAKAKRDEAARARAALEGQGKPAAAADDKGRFIVQIGAFAEADKVREVRQQAERAGLKTYTQVVDTKEGKRTRVRVGPYATRAEAEKAAAALQKAGLAGGIYAL